MTYKELLFLIDEYNVIIDIETYVNFLKELDLHIFTQVWKSPAYKSNSYEPLLQFTNGNIVYLSRLRLDDFILI